MSESNTVRDGRKPKEKNTHYVSNKKFYDLLVEYLDERKKAEQNGKPVPQIPNEIGRKIKLIAERLARRPNFSGYTYKDEMISDAIENCIMYLHCFDPEKSKNPFAYFTQFCYYAFIRRIKRENAEFDLKGKFVCQFGSREYDTQPHDDDALYANTNSDFLREFYGEIMGIEDEVKRGDEIVEDDEQTPPVRISHKRLRDGLFSELDFVEEIEE